GFSLHRGKMPEDVPGHLPRCPKMRLRCPQRWAHGVGMSSTTTDLAAPRSRVGLTRDEVMTAREVADLLHLPVSTVYELARRGELPAHRLGRTWRFLRPRLEEMLGA